MQERIVGQAEAAPAIRVSMLLSIATGTLLNPLNSSMIAVALVTIAKSYSVTIPTATWLVSGFYLAAAVGQPLMGRLADIFGPRRVFLTGLTIVVVAGVIGPFAPSLSLLVAVRALQALGTSAAFPSGLAMIRAAAGNPERPPAAALGLLSIAANVSAALGPSIGGAIIALADWQGIFTVNVPLGVLSILLALRFLPADPPRRRSPAGAAPAAAAERPTPDRGAPASPAGRQHPDRDAFAPAAGRSGTPGERTAAQGAPLTTGRRFPVDLAGILLFAATLALLLVFLLSLGASVRWPFLPAAVLCGLLFLLRERRAADPFVDLSMFRGGSGLGRIYATFAAVNTVFYGLFFGLPLWLEQARGLAPDSAGALMLPFAGLAVVATPLAARLIRLRGAHFVNLAGMAMMSGAALLLLLLHGRSPIWGIVAVTLTLGIPNAFNNLGLQAALFQAAPASKIGAASGLFQTFRYVGTFLSIALLGIIFGTRATSGDLHLLSLCLALIGGLLTALTLGSRKKM